MWLAASNSVMSWLRCSPRATTLPAMPLPTIAIFTPHLSEVPHDAERGEQPQSVIGEIDLPPVEPLARGAGEAVVVVMPALAEGRQREPRVVARIVARAVAARTETMCDRVDGEGRVVQGDGGDAQAPDHELHAAQRVQRHAEQKRGGGIVAVEPAQLRIAREIRHQRRARGEVLARQEPADVAPKEAVVARR